MVLSDRTIRAEIEAGRIVIDPFDERLVQPSSVDVRVDSQFRVFHNARYPYIDVRQPMEDLTELVEIRSDQPFILHPGEFVLGQTLERVTLPDDLVARLEGKSSLGRLGLLIHSTAGFVDSRLLGQPDARAVERRQPPDHDLPGHADRPDLLHAHGRPGRAPLRLAARTGRKYQGQAEPTPSRFYLNFDERQLRHQPPLPCGTHADSRPLEIVIVLVSSS